MYLWHYVKCRLVPAFQYTNYSLGAIHFTILDIPRIERFKKKNVILVRLIPDMKSESLPHMHLFS